jgi:hypothetical protein
VSDLTKYEKHQRKKRKCSFFDTSFFSDSVTCLNPDNPTAIQVCSDEHCPLKNSKLNGGK